MNTNRLFVGIDPGFTGAIVILDSDSRIIKGYDMPTFKVKNKDEIIGLRIFTILSSPLIEHVFIEKAQTMPNQGIVGAGRYMEGYGRIKGICEGSRLPYTLVHPTSWKKNQMRDMKKEKGASIQRCKQLYPGIKSLTLKKHHGRADAILIARYGVNLIKKGEL